MKLQKLALLLSTFALIGCGGGGSSSSNTSTDSTAVATSDAAAPASLPTGTEISFNPEIVFDGELSVGSPVTARYTNNSSSSSLPAGDNDNVSVTMTIVAGGIQVSFTQGGQSVELVLSGFKDYGAGYVEEFTVETKVNGTSLGKQQGRFVGSVKPKNSKVSKTADTNGTPTLEQFKRFVVGKALYHEETSPEPGDDKGYLVFNADGSISSFDLEPDDEKSKETWNYDYNGGTPILTIRDEHPTQGNPDHYHIYKVSLKFDNFFEGTYEGITEEEDGKTEADDDKGFWKIFDTASLSTNQ